MYQRHRVTTVVLRNLALIKKQVSKTIELNVLVAGSEGEASRTLVESFGFYYTEQPNSPLGRKWNNALDYSRRFDYTHLVVLGSDDLLNVETFKSYYLYKNYGCVWFRDLFITDFVTRRSIYLKGYYRQNRKVIGAGFMIARNIIEQANFKLWKNSLNKGLDGSMVDTINSLPLVFSRRMIGTLEGCVLVDLKSDVNIHGFTSLKGEKPRRNPLSYFPEEIFTLNNVIMPETTETFDVVIPYIETEKEFKELRYALRSIETNLKHEKPIRVVIVGDMPMFIKPETVKHIPLTRVDGIEFTNCYDAGRKMNAVILDDSISPDFLVMYDDTYLVQPVGVEELSEVLKMKLVDEFNTQKVHGKLLAKTFDVLKADVEAPANFETHTPRLINKQLMVEVYKKFKPIKNRLLHFTLYFNTHFDPTKSKTINKQNKYKIGFYGSVDAYSYSSDLPGNELAEKIAKYRFCNHNDAGLSAGLTDALNILFPEKSKFEV